jgi:hypothetical protein
MCGASVAGRVEVRPTGEQHTAEAIEQGGDTIEPKRREHHRQATGALDRAHVGHAERHLKSRRLAAPIATHLAGQTQLRGRHADQHRLMILREQLLALRVSSHASTQVSLAPPR